MYDERYEILTWLSKVDYEQHHKFISSARQDNTGNWLFEKPDFIAWRKSTSSIFWLHGIAGAGKTMLASMVIDTLKSQKQTNQALAYFYCKYGEIDRQEPQAILSTVVKQLSLTSPEGFLPEAVISLYDEQNNGVKSRRLGLDKSKELILHLSRAFDETIIIVDALDECNKDTRYQLLAALKELRSSSEGVKFFITSRNDDDILIQLQNESEVYIQPSDNSSDIELFAVAEVEKYISMGRLLRGEVRPELKHIIIDTLISGADRMFLWIQLQIKHICQEKTESAIRNALTRLPKDLKATYSAIWNKILANTEDTCLLAQRTLKWILSAKSPLTVEEMINAVSITPMKWVEKPVDNSISCMTLLDVCQNLVVLDKELGVFRTAHFSVSEFLLEKFDITEAHTTAAEVCLTFLCYENHLNTNRQTEKQVPSNSGVLQFTLNDVFGKYVMKNWAEHIRLSGDGSSTLAELQTLFFRPSPAYSKWLLAASKRDYNLQSKDSERQLNPLWVACYLRLWDIFKCLLRSNPDCTMRNTFGWTPIHSIARHGYSEGLKLLLEQEDVDLNAKDNNGWTPLYFATFEGHEKTVRLILECENVDVNAKNNENWTPLYFAANKGHERMVKLLLEHEAVDLNVRGGLNSMTPLNVAAHEGHEAVVRLLLEREGVELNAKDSLGRTPLYIAACEGHDVVVRVLLEQEGVDLNAECSPGWTPLFVATRKGHEKVLRLLLEQEGVDLIHLNTKYNFDWTPLFFAASMGYEAVVRLLFEREDVDLNAKDKSGRTPIFAAAHGGHEGVVRLLLEQEDVDLNVKDNFGLTPRQYSAIRGHVKVVRLISE
ncbi:hypothetical protein RUND412_003934, partial [Rhizina undulata]